MNKIFRIICITLFVIGFWVASAFSVSAAKISVFQSPIAQARFDHQQACLLDGDIVSGDAEKLEALFRDIVFFDCVLFLNSSGGSLEEALRIVKSMKNTTPTHIQTGDKCLSACAIIFIAGQKHTESETPIADRVLDIGGELGFHQPVLDLPNNLKLVPNILVVPAYTSAVQQIAELITLSRSGSASEDSSKVLPNELLLRMLNKTPDDMYLIETIEDVIISGVSLASGVHTVVKEADLKNVCDNYYWKSVGNYGKNDYFQYDATGIKHNRQSIRINNQSAIRFDGYDGYEGNKQTCDVIRENNYYLVRFADEEFKRVPRIFSLPRNQRIIDIRITSKPDNSLARESNFAAPANSNGLLCAVIRNSKILDRDPCTMAESVASGNKVKKFVWPSGAKTVLVYSNGKVSVNGATPVANEFSNGFNCVYNNNSGNYFCFSNR